MPKKNFSEFYAMHDGEKWVICDKTHTYAVKFIEKSVYNSLRRKIYKFILDLEKNHSFSLPAFDCYSRLKLIVRTDDYAKRK